MTAPVPLRRSRANAVLGGVCAGVARSAGLDPLLLRVALVAVTVLTGGAGALAYLAAWVLIPRATDDAAPPPAGSGAATPVMGTAGADVRTAWTAAGDDLRSLAAELRRPAPVTPAESAPAPEKRAAEQSAAPAPPDGAVPTQRAVPDPEPVVDPEPAAPRAEAGGRGLRGDADDAATALGERLRAPEVQAGARRAASSVTHALSASVDELGRRLRRDPE